MKRLRSFSSKLMILFSLSIILPTTIMIIILSNYFTTFLSNQNIEQFKNTLNSVSNNIDTYLDDLKRLTLTPYMYKEISFFLEYINNGNYADNSSDIDRYIKSKNYSSTLNKLINQSRQDILSITFIPYKDMSKGYVVSKYYDILSQVSIPDYYELWIKETLTADGNTFFTPVHTTQYNNGSEYQVFSIMRTIKNLDTKEIIGIVKIDAIEFTLKNIISSVNISNNSIFTLTDQNGQIIYSRNYSSKDNSLAILSNPNLNKSYNIVSTPISSSNWILLYLGSKADLYSSVKMVFFATILLASFFLIVAIIFFRINSNKIIKSVTTITSTMKKVREGDLSVRCTVRENDELSFISDALNNMIINLDTHIQNEYSSLIAVKNAEYLALQTQINPHFLCNTLNGLIALNRIGEKKLLEDSIIQLSSLYRYTCNNSDIASLSDEFLFAERYLNLQKLRFDDRIDFQITLGEDTSSLEIPKLILQPLIENSVKHGLKDISNPIFIKLYSIVSVDNNVKTLNITISDNGTGFILKEDTLPESVGLNSVKQRLLFFNKDSQFIINSKLNEGTTCNIIIPLGGINNENINS